MGRYTSHWLVIKGTQKHEAERGMGESSLSKQMEQDRMEKSRGEARDVPQ